MHRIAISSAMLLLVSSANPKDLRSEEPYWTPDQALIAKLEAGLKIMNFQNQATYQLTQYDRYYAGITVNGKRQIRGKLIVPADREDNPKTAIYITDIKDIPQLRGYGCANVRVDYYVDADEGFGHCDLTEVGAPPSEQPHWTPDKGSVARMEIAIQDFRRRTYPGLRDLNSYSRYYWGVTIDENQTIRGYLLNLSILRLTTLETGGIHLASDWDDHWPVIADGGCANIRIAFDLKSAKLTQCACDGELPMPLEKAP